MRERMSGRMRNRMRGYWIALCAIAVVLVTAGIARASGPDVAPGEPGVILAQVSPEQATPEALDLVQSEEENADGYALPTPESADPDPDTLPMMPLQDDDPTSPLNPEEDPMCGPDEVPYGDSCLPQPGGPGIPPLSSGDCPDGHFSYQGMCHPLPQGALPDSQ